MTMTAKPRRRTATNDMTTDGNGATVANGEGNSTHAEPAAELESTSAYFRRIFTETPSLLKAGNNDAIFARWLADHPGCVEVPKNVKANLANIKSVLRKGASGGTRRGRTKMAIIMDEAPTRTATKAKPHAADALTLMAAYERGLRDGAVIESRRQQAMNDFGG